MGGIKDSFYGDAPATYPAAPGFTDNNTSRRAAMSMRRTASTLRAEVLRVILAAPHGLTADEVAAAIGQSILAIRPRVTELGREHQPRIRKTTTTRPNESGRPAAVWVRV